MALAGLMALIVAATAQPARPTPAPDPLVAPMDHVIDAAILCGPATLSRSSTLPALPEGGADTPPAILPPGTGAAYGHASARLAGQEPWRCHARQGHAAPGARAPPSVPL